MEISAGIVTGRATARNREGLLPARLLQVMLTDERDVQTVQLVGQSGEESNPPNGALVIVLAEGEGFKLGAATADGIQPDMTVGGKRIYATDTDGAEVMAEVRLNPTGEVVVRNAAATITVSPVGLVSVVSDGEFHVTAAKMVFNNDVQINGAVTSTGDVTAGGKSLMSHTHSDPQGGDTGVPA